MDIREEIESLKDKLSVKTDEQLAQKLGVSRSTVAVWVNRGKFPKNLKYKLKKITGNNTNATNEASINATNETSTNERNEISKGTAESYRTELDLARKEIAGLWKDKFEMQVKISELEKMVETIRALELKIKDLQAAQARVIEHRVEPPRRGVSKISQGVRHYSEFELENEVEPINIKVEPEKATYPMTILKAAATPLYHREGSKDEHSDLDGA